MARLSARTTEVYANGGCFARVVSFGEHTGTHLDAPAHFHEGGATVEGIAAEDLVCRLWQVPEAFRGHAEGLRACRGVECDCEG